MPLSVRQARDRQPVAEVGEVTATSLTAFDRLLQQPRLLVETVDLDQRAEPKAMRLRLRYRSD